MKVGTHLRYHYFKRQNSTTYCMPRKSLPKCTYSLLLTFIETMKIWIKFWYPIINLLVKSKKRMRSFFSVGVCSLPDHFKLEIALNQPKPKANIYGNGNYRSRVFHIQSSILSDIIAAMSVIINTPPLQIYCWSMLMLQ